MGALFLKGLAFGFVLAATVGPMWVLCFRRTLSAGALAGFVSGMGIAVADALYGAVAAFGLTAVSTFLLAQQIWLVARRRRVSRLARREDAAARGPPDSTRRARVRTPQPRRGFLSTLGLTLANPPTILAFARSSPDSASARCRATRGRDSSCSAYSSAPRRGGSSSPPPPGALHGRLGPRLARAINIASGLTILGFAFWQFARLV